MNPNISSRLRGVIYRLKREWGACVDIYSRTTSEADVETGERNINATRTSLDYVIVPPSKVTREQFEGIFLSHANPRLTKGTGTDVNTRTFVIDRSDAPDLVIQKDDWIGYDGIRYDLDTIEVFPSESDPSIYIIQGVGLVGEPIPGIVQDVSVSVALDATVTAGETTT